MCGNYIKPPSAKPNRKALSDTAPERVANGGTSVDEHGGTGATHGLAPGRMIPRPTPRSELRQLLLEPEQIGQLLHR